ncbi:ras-related protein [Musa troglodytarum]|uniref:Ras-related protein n=1 Tax=Musa troglodytarum TaxID=320322 RepID=A0A9E7KIX9_9LILI|nr:ras-related protein [Musa troglodytarum]
MDYKGDEQQSQVYHFKIVMIGDSAVGKSNLPARFARNEFYLNSKSTIGVEFHIQKMEIDGWDTAAHSDMNVVTTKLISGMQGKYSRSKVFLSQEQKPDTSSSLGDGKSVVFQGETMLLDDEASSKSADWKSAAASDDLDLCKNRPPVDENICTRSVSLLPPAFEVRGINC